MAYTEKDRTYHKEYRAKNLATITVQQKDYYAKNRETILARMKNNYAKNREAVLVERKKYREQNHEAIKAWQSEHSRREWQRSGSGVHLARIGDWTSFFDGLASEQERCIAAHVLMFFADVDTTASKVFSDPGFDYTYIAHHFEE